MRIGDSDGSRDNWAPLNGIEGRLIVVVFLGAWLEFAWQLGGWEGVEKHGLINIYIALMGEDRS